MINTCTSLACSTLTRHQSDHFPILLDFQTSSVRYSSNFKFLKMWSHYNNCSSFIKQVLSNQVLGSPMHILSHKLKILKGELKTWNKTVFGNIHNEVKKVVNALDLIQQNIFLNGHNDILAHQEKIAKIELDKVLNMEEAFWKEKACIQWHNEGDRNTAFFHRTAKIKQTYKKISSLKIDDVVVTDPSHISNHVVNHFTSLFTNSNDIQTNNLIDETIPHLISDFTNNLLTILPSVEEIKNAVFSLNKDSAPGPDGFGAFFFQTYWDIIKEDVIAAVLEFFIHNHNLPNMNANTVVLIPKVPDASTINQFRPIALANCKFPRLLQID